MRVSIESRIEHSDGRRWEAHVGKCIRRAVKVGLAHRPVRSCAISLVLTNDANIRVLNREHRSLDSATDVLSFPLFERDEIETLEDGLEPCYLGDLVISLDTAARHARRRDLPMESELALLSAHGVLHLLGHDHMRASERRIMRALEGRILGELGIDPEPLERPAHLHRPVQRRRAS